MPQHTTGAQPAHFHDIQQFRIYIYDCALRDRESYLEAIKDADNEEAIAETISEIRAIKRLCRAYLTRSNSQAIG